MPNEVLTLDKLERLDFYTNSITGTLPEGIAGLTNLVLFDLEQNLLTGSAFPDALFDMRALVAYRISDNFVSGTIAREISTMQNLQQLWAATNVLSGTIPTQIASPPSLQSIFLYENALIGTIPSEIGMLTKLEDLRLYSNTLQATIPPGLFSATRLQALMLEFNFFSGTVPSEIGLLTELVDLRLDTNSLTGPFPAELGRLSMLGALIAWRALRLLFSTFFWLPAKKLTYIMFSLSIQKTLSSTTTSCPDKFQTYLPSSRDWTSLMFPTISFLDQSQRRFLTSARCVCATCPTTR
jgi:hypothetical protein